MADVSEWSATDGDNTAAPPNGWPEFQSASSVNNCARAMMGAIKRWYDNITVQVNGIAASVANMLPLTGGTITGSLVVNGTLGSLSAIGCTGIVTAGGLVSTGNISAGNNATISGTATVGALGVTNDATVGGTATVAALSVTNNATVGGTVTAGALSVSGALTLAALSVTNNATIGGALNTGGGITGNTWINTTEYRLNGVKFADIVSGNATQIYDPAGNPGLITASTGNNFYRANAHSLMNYGATLSWAIFNSGGSYNISGSWLVISEDTLKEDIAPYSAGLAAVRALRPVSFRYRAGPFVDGATRYGLLASEVAAVLPEMVGETEVEVDGKNQTVATLNPGHLIWLLISSVNEMASRIEALEKGEK